MLDNKRKLECVRWLKKLAIEYQRYEAAAVIRDHEKSLLSTFGLSSYEQMADIHKYEQMADIHKLVREPILEDFNLKELEFIQSLIDRHFGKEFSELISELIQFRRIKKIDGLIDDE